MGVNELDYKKIGQRIRAERNKKGWLKSTFLPDNIF